MDQYIKTDVPSEPLLEVLTDGGEQYINQYLKELTDNITGDDQAIIEKMATAAREWCEKYTQMCFAQKTLVATYLPDDVDYYERVIPLPSMPISSITSVKSISADGTETALTEDIGYYTFGNKKVEISIPKVFSTSVGTNEKDDSIQVEYIAGYGAPGNESLPEVLRQAMAKLVVDWWHSKGNWIPYLSSEVRRILDLYGKY